MMLNAAAVAKQLAAGSDPKVHDRTLAALMRLSSYLTLSGHALPTLLWPELERLLLDGDDLPPRHRVLVYAIARASGGSSVGPNSASGRCGLMERPSVLNAIAKDLTDPTVNDPGVLAASTAALATLPSAALLRFFARPSVDASGDPEAGAYACEAGAEALGRVLSHPDVCVVTACVPSVARAVVRAFGLVHCPAVLRDAAAHRGHESQAATLRFGEVVRDRVAEVFARLVDLTLGVDSSNADGSDERVIFAAATALHQGITTAAASGAAGFPGWSWSRDARLLAKQQALVLGHSADTSAAAAATVAAGDENSFVGNGSGNCGSSGSPGLSPRAGRDLHALLMVQLLGKPLKKEALLRAVSHHASGGLAHPALLKLGTDLLLAALREAPPPPSQAARSTRNQSQASQQHQQQQQREQQLRADAAALRAWAEGALATACASSVSEEQSVGCAQLSRALHEPHPLLWAGSQGPAKRAQLFGLVVDKCLGLVVRAPWDSCTGSNGGSGSSENHRSGGDAVRSRASSTSQSTRRRGNSITSSSSSSTGATSAATAAADAASSERCYKPALHHHWPALNLNSCDAAWVALALTCLPGSAVAIPVHATAAAATAGKRGPQQASQSIERALLPARAAQLARFASVAPKVATRLAMLGACCRVLVADPSILPQSYSSSGGKTSSACDEDVGPSPAACVATFLAHPWVEATLSNRRPLLSPHAASRRSNGAPSTSSANAGAAAAATAAVAVGLANATTWPEGDHCRHELAIALLSAVSHQWSQCMVSSELAFRRDARILEEDHAKEAAKYENINEESVGDDENRGGSSDGQDGNNGLRRGAQRSKKGVAAVMATLGTTERDDAQEERSALLARIAARSAALRWSECAAVLLGCQELAAAASSNGGTAGSSGGSKSRGRRLVECLSWPCSDEPLFGAAGDLNGNLLVGGGVGCIGGGGGSSGGGAANQQFPSGAAPSAWVRLLALSLRCAHGGCGALRHEETLLGLGDEAARSAGGQRTSDWVQKRTKAATAAAAAHADLNAIDETVEALREKVAALHDLGEAEMATSLSATVAKECAKRHRQAALMVLPRAQERRRWCGVTQGLCKLIGDVVVWQFGRGLPDRSTRVQLLCLLVDAWPSLCSSHKQLKALAHYAASEHAHFHHDMHGHGHSGSDGGGSVPMSPDRGGMRTPPPPLRPVAQSSDSLGSAGSNSGGMLRRTHSAPIDSNTPPPPAPPPAPLESPGMLRAAGFTGRRSHSMSNGSDFDDRSMIGSDFGSMSRVEYDHDDVDAGSMARSDLEDENASMGGDDVDDDMSWSFGGSVGWGGGGSGMGDAVAQDLARELTRELMKPTLSPAAIAASVSSPAVTSFSPTKAAVASASPHSRAASSSLRSSSLPRDHSSSSQNNGGGDHGSGDDDSGDEGNSHQGSLSGVGSGTVGSGLSGSLGPNAGAAAATGVNSASKLNAMTSGGRGAWVGLLGGGTNARPYAPSATHEATAVLMLEAAVRLALRCPSAAATEVTTAIEDLLSSMDRNACLQTTLPPAAMTTVLFTREAVVSLPSPALVSGSRRGSTALAVGFGSGWGCGPDGGPGGEAGTFRGSLLHARAVLSAAALFANNDDSNNMSDGSNRTANGDLSSTFPNGTNSGHQPSSAGFESPPPGGVLASSADPSDPFALRPENADPFRTPVANNHPSSSSLAGDAFAPRAEPDPFLADPNSYAAGVAVGEAPASNGFFGAANAFGVGFGAEKSNGVGGGSGIGGIGNGHRGNSGSVDEGFFGGGFASPASDDAESAVPRGNDFFGEAPSSTGDDQTGARIPQPKNGHHHHRHPAADSLPGGPAVALSPALSGGGLVVDAMGRSISAAHGHSSGTGGHSASLTPLRAALLGEHISTGAVPGGVTSSLNDDTLLNGSIARNSGLYFLAAASAAGTAFAGCGLTGGYTDPGGSLGLSDGRGASYAPAGILSSTSVATGAAAVSRASPLRLNGGPVPSSWGAAAAVPGVPVLADRSIVTASSSSQVVPRWNGLPAGSGSGAAWGGTWAARGGASNIVNQSDGDGSSSSTSSGHSHRAAVLGVGSTTLFAEGPVSAPSALHYARVAAGGLATGLAGNSPLDDPRRRLSSSLLDSNADRGGLLKMVPSSADAGVIRNTVHWRQFAAQVGGASDPLQGQLVVAVVSGANEGNIGAASAAPPVVEVELTAHNATNCVLHGVGARLVSADAVPPPPPSLASGRSAFGNGNHSSGSSFASPISLNTTTSSLSSSSHQVQNLGGALAVVSGPQKAEGPIEGLPSGATIVWRWRIELPSFASLVGGVASSPASLLAAGISGGGGASSSANEKEDVLAWQRACVSVCAQLWFTTLDVEDPGDSSDSEDDDEPPAVKGGADGRRARGQSGDGVSSVSGGGRPRASSSHNVDIDDDSDEEVADFGADAEADAKAKEEAKGPKPPVPVPCLLPPARLLLPPTAFLHPAAASARTPAAFAALWSALPFAHAVQAKLPVDQSAHSGGNQRVNLLLLGQSHRDARVSLPADSAFAATSTTTMTSAASSSSNVGSHGAAAAAATSSGGVRAASQLAQQWRGSATFAFLWRSDAASQWAAVVVSALRVVDPPLLHPQVKPKRLERPSQMSLSGGASADGSAKDEVSSTSPHSPPPSASTTSERPVPEVLGDVCFAAGVPEGLPPATAVAEAAKKAGPAYAAALRRRNAATATKSKPLGPPGLREQLHMLAHLYGIPTTTAVDAVADEPAATPVVEANEDEEVSAVSAVAGSSAVRGAVNEQVSATGSPSTMPDRDTQSASHGKARKLPSSEWVFEVETRSGDAAFLSSLFAPYELPAAAAAAGSSSRYAAPTCGHYNFASPLSRAVADLSTRNGFFSEGGAAPAATALLSPVCAGAHWLDFVGGLVLDTPDAPAGSNRSDQSIAAPDAAAPSDAPTKAALAAVGGSSETKKAPRLRTMSLGLHAPRGISFQETAQGSEAARLEEVRATGPSPEAATKTVLPAWRRLREERDRLGLCRPVS